MLDIELLRIIWWLLLGFLIIGFAIYDGFDFGVAMLLPLVTRNEFERNAVLNSIRPFWEGNQVWIILGAGALFAAWPYVYAVAFSGAYFPMLLLLLTMGIMRPVSFKFRGKLQNRSWRNFWDTITIIGGLAPSILFGILVGNTIVGLPFHFDKELRLYYSGSVLQLFNPFALWCAALSVLMFIMHGGLYLAVKSDGPVHERCVIWAKIAAIWVVILFGLGGILIAFFVPGYEVISTINAFAPSNPLNKHVIQKIGAWLNNYDIYPAAMTLPVLGLLGALGAFFLADRNDRLAFICSSAAIAGIISTVGVSMFPFILPSSTEFGSSLLVWDASSSALTLLLMLVGTAIFMPIILLYTTWVYHVLRGKVTERRNEETPMTM